MNVPTALIDSDQLDDEIRAMFDQAVSEDPVDDRDVRFAVYRLQRLGDPHAVRWILENLVTVPNLAPYLVPYLSELWDNHNKSGGIETTLREFLSDPRLNIYPLMELHLMRLFARASSLDDATIQCVRNVVMDANRASFSRAHAARCLGRHALNGDVLRLRQLIQSSPDFYVKRGALVALYEAGGATAGYLGQLATAQEDLSMTCSYLKTRPQLEAP